MDGIGIEGSGNSQSCKLQVLPANFWILIGKHSLGAPPQWLVAPSMGGPSSGHHSRRTSPHIGTETGHHQLRCAAIRIECIQSGIQQARLRCIKLRGEVTLGHENHKPASASSSKLPQSRQLGSLHSQARAKALNRGTARRSHEQVQD